jgi:hypothetical protein
MVPLGLLQAPVDSRMDTQMVRNLCEQKTIGKVPDGVLRDVALLSLGVELEATLI